MELVQVQKVGQLASIDAVALVPDFNQRVLARIAHQHVCNMGLQQIV